MIDMRELPEMLWWVMIARPWIWGAILKLVAATCWDYQSLEEVPSHYWEGERSLWSWQWGLCLADNDSSTLKSVSCTERVKRIWSRSEPRLSSSHAINSICYWEWRIRERRSSKPVRWQVSCLLTRRSGRKTQCYEVKEDQTRDQMLTLNGAKSSAPLKTMAFWPRGAQLPRQTHQITHHVSHCFHEFE